MTIEPGTNLGPYRVLGQLGQGGMATVYKAYHAALDRQVAIKVLPAALAADRGFRDRFQQEAVAVAKLRHPNILAIYDHGEDGGVRYLVTEFVDGGTLADQLGRPLPVDYLVQMLGPVASALDYAHARGVLHRDIKPSNILLNREGTPVLSDFGLAKMMSAGRERLTQTGMILGTPEYMSPEQCSGDEVGPASDIYSLTVVAYEMLTGRPPFSAATPAAVLVAQMHDPLPLPRSINPELPATAESALLKGLAKAPGDRFKRAGELLNALSASVPAVSGPVLPAPAAVGASGPSPAHAVSQSPRWESPVNRSTIGEPPHPVPARDRGFRRLVLASSALVAVLLLGSGAYVLVVHPAATRPALGPAASPAAGLTRGPLIFQAKLDASGSDLGKPGSHGPPGSTEIKFLPGAVELDVSQPGGNAYTETAMGQLSSYIGEISFSATPGSRMYFDWAVRSSDGQAPGNHVVEVDTFHATATLLYLAPPAFTHQPLAPAIPLPGLQTGKSFTLSALVDPPRYQLYVNGVLAANASDPRSSGIGNMALGFGGESGSIRITSIRAYALPAPRG